MLTLVRSSAFKRDVKRAERRGREMEKLKRLLLLLIERKNLPASYRDHPRRGGWAGYRDAHIAPDWLLIYRVVGDRLELARTGSHADLFYE